MKFNHAADLHLDSPFRGLISGGLPSDLEKKILDSTFTSFKNLVDDALFQNVDFVLLAGDLFDRNDQSLRSKIFLDQQLERLNQKHIPVFIIFGNHDFLQGGKDSLGFPDNTKVFGPKPETKYLTLKSGQRVAIHGFSFNKQWITKPIIKDYPVADQSADWNIGMLHGSADSVKSQDNYAPFTLSDLQSKNYDYWALGHIHKRQSLDNKGLINYSGNTQGRHINETGKKGYLLVESNGKSLSTSFHSTAPIIWQKILIPVSSKAANTLIKNIFDFLHKQEFKLTTFIRIVLDFKGPISDELINKLNDGEVEEVVRDQSLKDWQNVNFFVTSLKFETSQQIKFSQIDQKYFDEAKLQTLTSKNLEEIKREFMKYDFIQDFLSSSIDQKDIFNLAAQEILSDTLITGGNKSDN